MNTTILPLAATQTRAHERLSTRYGFAPTSEIISAMESQDWVVTAASSARVRDPGRDGYQRHLLRFAHRSQLETSKLERIETVLINSHDGTSSLQLGAGVFRFACANGIVIADSTVAGIRLGHHRLTMDKVLTSAETILGQAERVTEVIGTWRDTPISAEDALHLAEQGIVLRWGDLEKAPITPHDVLTVRRAADAGNDLWTVFNRTQESILRGELSATRYRANGRRYRAPAGVRSLTETVRLNKGLWEVASQIALQA